MHFDLAQPLRYGENPHQEAAFYRDLQPAPGSLGTYRQVQGKALSYNNIADADAAWECVKSFDQPACVIVKHANPCGVAVAEALTDAYQKAFATDPTSAFGGIIAFNRELDGKAAAAVAQQFVEVVIAPSLDDEAITAKLATFHAMLQVEGAEPPKLDVWGRRTLAYPIRKKDVGYYVVANLDTDPTLLPEYERALKLDEELLRHLVVLSEGELGSPLLVDDEGDEDDDGDQDEDEDEED